jgi:hypothetical protein
VHRKVERKVNVTFCRPARLDHATMVARALRWDQRRQHENRPVHPAGHARQGVEDKAGSEPGAQQAAVEDEAGEAVAKEKRRCGRLG